MVPQGAQPSGSGQKPAVLVPPIPRYSLRQTKERLARQPQPSTENINAILANLGEEGQCLAYTSPSGYNFNIDMNYMSI